MINNIIASIMYMFGISSAPVTVYDFLWDCLIIVVGLYIVKYVMIFITSLFSEMMRIN